MCSRLCTLLPKDGKLPDKDECKKGDDVEVCNFASKCWEFARDFEGGSVPWKGTSREQEAARRRAETEEAEPPCVWSRCAEFSCPMYSCSGSYDLEKWRPMCKDITTPEDKGYKKPWCWTPEASILTHCDPCPPPRYFCPEPEVKVTCPHKMEKYIPLYRWKFGFPYPNIQREPYPHLLEGLEWKNKPPMQQPPRSDTDLWALGCTSMVGDEPTHESCARPPPCPGRFVHDVPLFLWRSCCPKENYAKEPYPGHGPRPFDPCQYRQEQRRLRERGSPRPCLPEEHQKEPCRTIGRP